MAANGTSVHGPGSKSATLLVRTDNTCNDVSQTKTKAKVTYGIDCVMGSSVVFRMNVSIIVFVIVLYIIIDSIEESAIIMKQNVSSRKNDEICIFRNI